MSMVFCRGCGKEIHESAPTCPHCGAPQGNSANQKRLSFLSYDQVPWYRKNWFAIVSFFIFPPILWVVLLTGDVYYVRSRELRTYSIWAKIILGFLAFALIKSVLHHLP